MSWKCDKCHRKYDDSVSPTEIQGFKFCGSCLSGNSDAAFKANEKNKKKKVRIILTAAAAVFAGSIAAGVILFKSNMRIAIPVWIAGFVAAVVLTAAGESVEKRK